MDFNHKLGHHAIFGQGEGDARPAQAVADEESDHREDGGK